MADQTSTGRAMCTEETTRITQLEAERTELLHLLWECHCAASDGVPVPFNSWLLDAGPAGMPQDVKELREAYDTVSEHEHKCIGVRDHYFAGLEHIAKTWANGNGAGPAAKLVLETAPDADMARVEHLQQQMGDEGTDCLCATQGHSGCEPGKCWAESLAESRAAIDDKLDGGGTGV